MRRKKMEREDGERREAPLAQEKARIARTRGLSLGTVARDIATVGSGTVVAAVFNVMVVFLIPRLVSIEDFGYWRLFLLYAGYAGFLHMGLSDGALLRWAGKSLEEFHNEIAPSLKFLFWQQAAVIVPGGLLAAWLLRPPLNLVGVAVLVYSMIFNSAALLQFSLQGARLFRPVAVGLAAPPGLFVLMVVLWHLRGTPGFRELMLLYCIAWAGVLTYLWIRVRPGWGGGDPAWSVGKTCVTVGWPVLLANGGFLLVQSADRLAVSSALPIQDFAQYSLAASTMSVPVVAIVAVSKVFFSHAAAVEHEGRALVYGHASRLLVLAWSLLLPYYFGLEVFVRHFLPKYVRALPVAAILVPGVVFLAGIQILHMSYAYLYGKQRQFLAIAVGAFVVSVTAAIVIAVWLRSLTVVATGQVAALALWWLANEWSLRKISGQEWKDWLGILAIAGWSAASFGFVLWVIPNVGWQIPAYYLLVTSILWFSCPKEFRLGWRLVQARGASPS